MYRDAPASTAGTRLLSASLLRCWRAPQDSLSCRIITLSLEKKPSKKCDCAVQLLPKRLWAPHLQLGHTCPQKSNLSFICHGLLPAVAPCLLLPFLPPLPLLRVYMSLSHTHASTHTPIHRQTHDQIRTQDTSIQQPKQAEIPKIPLVPEAVRHPTLNSSFTASLQGRASSHHHHRPTDSRPDPLMLGSHAACSKQMPAYKDSHQSSHTEADCAGSLFHSNKGASAEQRLCRLSLHGPQGRLELRGEGGVSDDSCTVARFEVALEMKIYRQGHG